MPPDSSEATLERKIARLRNDCGCEVGAVMALLALGSALVYVFQLGADVSLVIKGGMTVGALLGGASLGKILGLLIARVRLHRALAARAHRRAAAATIQPSGDSETVTA